MKNIAVGFARRTVLLAALAVMVEAALPPTAASALSVTFHVGMHGSEIRLGRFDPGSGILAMEGEASMPHPT